MENKDELRNNDQDDITPWLMRHYFRVNLAISLLLIIIYFTPICLSNYSRQSALSDFMEGWPLFGFWFTIGCLFILNFINKRLLKDWIVAICNIAIYFVNVIAVFGALYNECYGSITKADSIFYIIYLSLIFIVIWSAKSKLNAVKMDKDERVSVK